MNCYFLLLLLKLNNAVGANGSGKSNVLYGEIEPLEFLVSDAVILFIFWINQHR